MTPIAKICCVLVEPYGFRPTGRQDSGLNFLCRVKGRDVRPWLVSDPFSSTPGETAKKCVEAGVSLNDTMRLVPPPRRWEDFQRHMEYEKEIEHGRRSIQA